MDRNEPSRQRQPTSRPFPDPGGGVAGELERVVAEYEQWDEYALLVDLYKFYLDLVAKGLAAYFVILGGVVTLVLTNSQEQSVVAWALLVPIVMSVMIALAARRGTRMVAETREAVTKVAAKLKVTQAPHVELLEWLVGGLIPLVLLAAALLTALLVWLLATH